MADIFFEIIWTLTFWTAGKAGQVFAILNCISMRARSHGWVQWWIEPGLIIVLIIFIDAQHASVKFHPKALPWGKRVNLLASSRNAPEGNAVPNRGSSVSQGIKLIQWPAPIFIWSQPSIRCQCEGWEFGVNTSEERSIGLWPRRIFLKCIWGKSYSN